MAWPGPGQGQEEVTPPFQGCRFVLLTLWLLWVPMDPPTVSVKLDVVEGLGKESGTRGWQVGRARTSPGRESVSGCSPGPSPGRPHARGLSAHVPTASCCRWVRESRQEFPRMPSPTPQEQGWVSESVEAKGRWTPAKPLSAPPDAQSGTQVEFQASAES